ncbi:MAG TPA: MBL fold metallo-hydrolase [Pseudolysinimonas sp.]|nr:MBL fold metallo-hydrolase [Pseudolysinimonas sp.]
MSATLQVLGAADTVTGSRYLISTDSGRVLVDCGLFQGYKALRERNRLPFPVDPASLDAVLITHAHLDHIGYLPALVRDGFTGPVYATRGTVALARILLPDSGRLLEEEADTHRRRGSSRHADPRPLYTELDAFTALRSFRGRSFGDDIELLPDVSARFIPAGHIVGAAQIRFDIAGTVLHFTGDLGRNDDPIMRPPIPLESADVLVTESTYGDRTHPKVDAEAELAAVINRVAARGGVLVIAAFAVGRAENLAYHLSHLKHAGAIPDIPVFLNSPMAIEAGEIYSEHLDELRLSPDDVAQMDSTIHLIRTVDESIWLNEQDGPMLIIAASGMLTGGRVLHHLARFGPDPKNAIVLTGYQAGGTRGGALAHGERSIRVFGRDIPIGAEVVQLESMSAHADADLLLEWMRGAVAPPSLTLVTHGDADSADALRVRIQNELGWNVRVPQPLEVFRLPTA